MINKKGRAGELIAFMFIIGLIMFAVVTIYSGLDDMEVGCQGANVTTTIGCELIGEDSPFGIILKNKVILIIMIIIPIWMIFGRVFLSILSIFRGIFRGMGEFFEPSYSDFPDDPEDKDLKKMKSKLKKDLNRKPVQNIEESKGVERGSGGISLGPGIDTYETKMKGGDEKKDG